MIEKMFIDEVKGNMQWTQFCTMYVEKMMKRNQARMFIIGYHLILGLWDLFPSFFMLLCIVSMKNNSKHSKQ